MHLEQKYKSMYEMSDEYIKIYGERCSIMYLIINHILSMSLQIQFKYTFQENCVSVIYIYFVHIQIYDR